MTIIVINMYIGTGAGNSRKPCFTLSFAVKYSHSVTLYSFPHINAYETKFDLAIK